jgi:hypothetical protein
VRGARIVDLSVKFGAKWSIVDRRAQFIRNLHKFRSDHGYADRHVWTPEQCGVTRVPHTVINGIE